MSHFSQTSVHNADKILNGAQDFLNRFNKSKKNNDSQITLINLISEFNHYPIEEKKKLAKALWIAGKASAITNSPYNIGMSETVFQNRKNEREYLNKVNNCLKEAIINDFDNKNISKLTEEVKDTLIFLDKLSISTQKRQNLYEDFKNNFLSIDPKNEILTKCFYTGLNNYNQFTLKQTLAKFLINTNNDKSTLNNENGNDSTISPSNNF